MMKNSIKLGLVVALGATALSAFAQYAIPWHSSDGGGGSSSGGTYSLTGTAGQADARTAPMSGGTYSVTGGLWAVSVVQTPGAPALSISKAGPGQVTLSWTPDEPGWVLQESSTLAPGSWSDAPSGSTNNVTVPATGGKKFFRLHKP